MKPPVEKVAPLELERRARELLTATAVLVSAAEGGVGDLEALRASASDARVALEVLLDRGHSTVDRAVLNQARVLLGRLHEAALELDLGMALGAKDPFAQDALRRANTAVQRDGRALLRAMSHLIEAVELPPSV